ncbi:XRE family transcriptional regulator [Caulobacter sp. CCNWLY153]|uniref:DNA-binding protein n=1 Tax=Caulobacter radicis TaxID=2172650 RepID=A0A2T9JB35_9CAUL|nr:XRE family transcriptional regulator [Caulobacter radicis]PVM79435.1 DNA-binding protein [Caulobacter radicis]
MRVGTPGFIPGRLSEARDARRIPTMSALARQLGINPSTVSRWEDGAAAPDNEALQRLSAELGVRPEYFLRDPLATKEPVFFRSLASTLTRDLNYQRAQMRWLQEISSTLENYVDLPVLDLPDVLGGGSWRQLRDSDLDAIALDLRRHWRIGEGPCTDVVSILERVGFVVATIEMGTAKLDGLCSWSPIDGRPHVLLATDKMSFPRRQMDAAHEMAHALLHRGVSDEEFQADLKAIEAQAFRLASAFLLPATTYPLEVKSASLAQLLLLKERWRVSVKAQIRRLADLGLVSPEYATQMYKLHSAKGWTKEEPLDKQWEPSKPRVLREALQLIVDEGVRTKADLLAVEFTIAPDDITNLVGLPTGWFDRDPAEVVRLKPTSRPPMIQAGDVVPFRRK